jgi:NCAIR mutase (PurE)-related protein
MHKIVFTLLIFSLAISGLNAQQSKREKLKAYKTAFITQRLDLSSKEAEKFWPIYNVFEKKMYQLKVLNMREGRKQIKENGGMEALNDEDAEKIVSKLIQNEQDILEAKKELINDLKNVISAKKILKLYGVEHEFNKKLLEEFRNKKQSR